MGEGEKVQLQKHTIQAGEYKLWGLLDPEIAAWNNEDDFNS